MLVELLNHFKTMVVVSEQRNEVVSIHDAAIWMAVMGVLIKSYLVTCNINIFIWRHIYTCLLHFGLHGRRKFIHINSSDNQHGLCLVVAWYYICVKPHHKRKTDAHDYNVWRI